MRGKETIQILRYENNRITPAYAGKRYRSVDWLKFYTDPPRLCGEKPFLDGFAKKHVGSPPPMRGKAETFAVADLLIGITPAYAGKSLVQCVADRLTKDHPRLCGEKTKKIPKQRYFFHQLASFSFSLQYT